MSRFGRLLRIDLSSRTFRGEEIPDDIQRAFVGGKGLGTAYLSAEVCAHTDALAPENKLYFCPGALVGTLAPAACRYELVTISPLTGLYLDCNSGGHLATAIKSAGYDMLAVEGRADRPTAVYVHDDRVTFLDAQEWWGRSTYETETALRQRLGDAGVRVASIGVAGEKRVRLACVANDYSRQAARGGPGAVMGAKQLKALAVSGTHPAPVARPQDFLRAVEAARATIASNPWVPSKREHGTPGSLEPMYAVGAAPVNNFTASSAEGLTSLALDEFIQRTALRLACAMCPVSCSKGYRLTEGDSAGGGFEGPEYETASMLGPNCGLYDLEEIAAANYLCNTLGLDTISAGASVGLLLHALDEGLLSPRQLDLPEHPASRGVWVHALLRAMAYRQGVGDLLAEGAVRAGEELGLQAWVAQVKGMDFPAYDPRVSEGMALAYMTSDRGACHLRTWPLGRELSGELPRWGMERKVEFVVNQQNDKAAEECLGACQFPYGIGLLSEDLPHLLSAATGEHWDLASLRTVGERIWNLSRVFNARRGIGRQDDYLPARFEQPLPQGPIAGHTVGRALQDEMLDRYYALRSWSPQGVPLPETLERLGLRCLTAEPPTLEMRGQEAQA